MEGRAGGAADRWDDRDHRAARGMFRETFAMSKAYAEARAQYGENEPLNEIGQRNPRWITRGITHPKSSRITGSGTSGTRRH
jgi:hypothetical protein